MKNAAVHLMLNKYDLPVTGYAGNFSAPHCNSNSDAFDWEQTFKTAFNKQNHVNGLALDIHLPYYPSSGIFTHNIHGIALNDDLQKIYISFIENEWICYRRLMMQTPVIRELHLSEGTLTFFSPANLQRLLQFILKGAVIHPQHEFSFVSPPRNAFIDYLQMLYLMGFRNICFDAQNDFTGMQKVKNNLKAFQNKTIVIEKARAIGFRLMNFNVFYGLPGQTKRSLKNAMNKIIILKPERIFFSNYDDVSKANANSRYNESHLPTTAEKMILYTAGKELLIKNGYLNIHSNQFILPGDDLLKMYHGGKLYRNFIGYTTRQTGLLLQLGASITNNSSSASLQDSGEIF